MTANSIVYRDVLQQEVQQSPILMTQSLIISVVKRQVLIYVFMLFDM